MTPPPSTLLRPTGFSSAPIFSASPENYGFVGVRRLRPYVDGIELASLGPITPQTLSAAVVSCIRLRKPLLGTALHALALRTALLSHPRAANSLLSFYAKSHFCPKSVEKLFESISFPDAYSYTTLLSAYSKSGHFCRALQLFDRMPQRPMPVWNAMITGSINNGHRTLAIDLFRAMHRSGVGFDKYTFASVLSMELLGLGRQVHSMVIRTGFLESTVAVVNALVAMYFYCGIVRDGVRAFREADVCDVITYNATVGGLVRWGRDEDGLMVFKEMMCLGLKPTELTFVCVFSACSLVEIAGQVYGQVVKLGFDDSSLVGNATVAMYCGAGDLVSARCVFGMIRDKDVVSWNSMISGYSQKNLYDSAIELYHEMLGVGIEPDEFTYGSLAACSRVTKQTETIQSLVSKNGIFSSIQVCNALVSAYCKCGEIDSAHRIFDEMCFPNLISWNSIISGCMLNGFPLRSLELFSCLLISGLKPNSHTLSNVLSTSAVISALRFGKQVHAYILKSGSDSETSIGNALITMYGKCGDLDCSSKVFSGMPERDVITWNAIIAAYSQNGDGREVMHYFEMMQKSEILPDRVTFIIILSACSHAGFVRETRSVFSSMVEDYNVEPGLDHYSCIIDLLGRAGHLEEAETLIDSMPYRANSHIWWSLLSACATHGNMRLGRIAAGFLLEFEPENPAMYVLLSNINAAQGKWVEASSVRDQMRLKGVEKNLGCSWIESENCSAVVTV